MADTNLSWLDQAAVNSFVLNPECWHSSDDINFY